MHKDGNHIITNVVRFAINLTSTNGKDSHADVKENFQSYLTSQKNLETSCEVPQRNELRRDTESNSG